MSLRDIIIMCVMPCGSRLSVRVCRPPLHQRRPAALRLTSGARVLYCVRRRREAVAVGTACVCLRLESSRSSTHNKQQMLLLSSPSHSSQSGDRVRGSAFPSLSLCPSLNASQKSEERQQGLHLLFPFSRSTLLSLPVSPAAVERSAAAAPSPPLV